MDKEIGIIVHGHILRILLDVNLGFGVIPSLGFEIASHCHVICDLSRWEFVKNRYSDRTKMTEYDYYMFKVQPLNNSDILNNHHISMGAWSKRTW